MAKKPRLLRVKRSPRYEGEGRGRNEGEGETRLIKRRPPPSANGPTAQELHAGNCCANTTTFILQPLGKRHILFNQERCCAPSLPLSSFLVRNLDLDSCLLVFGTRVGRDRSADPNDLATELSIADVKCKRRGRERGKYWRRLFSDNLEIPRDRIDSRSLLQRHQWKMTRGALYRHSPPLLTVAVLRWT